MIGFPQVSRFCGCLLFAGFVKRRHQFDRAGHGRMTWSKPAGDEVHGTDPILNSDQSIAFESFSGPYFLSAFCPILNIVSGIFFVLERSLFGEADKLKSNFIHHSLWGLYGHMRDPN